MLSTVLRKIHLISIIFLTTRSSSAIAGKILDTSSKKAINVTSSEALLGENKLPNTGNDNKTSSEKPEALPTPEALFWSSNSKPSRYLSAPGAYRGRRPTPFAPSMARDRINSIRTNGDGDYFYRNRKGEWIYILPEEDLDYLSENYLPKASGIGSRMHESGTHLRRYKEAPTNHLNIRDEIPPSARRPTSSVGSPYQTQVSPFWKKIIDTGNGFLRFLNPLTYLVQKDPIPVLAYSPEEQRQRYNPKYRDSYRYNRHPTSSPSYTRSPDFKYHRDPYKRDPNLQDYKKYRDYSESSDFTHDVDDYDFKDDYDDYSYFDEGNNYEDYSDGFEESNLYDNPIEGESGKSFPQPPPNYDPRKPKKVTDLENVDSHYDDAYNYQNINTASYLESLENLKYVKDEYTLDYLRKNRLRDDLYIGKDGSIYLKDSKEIDGEELDGFQMYGMSRLVPRYRRFEENKQRRLKRYPPYKNIAKRKPRKNKQYSAINKMQANPSVVEKDNLNILKRRPELSKHSPHSRFALNKFSNKKPTESTARLLKENGVFIH